MIYYPYNPLNIAHPHLCPVFESSVQIRMLLEYASGGELYDHINSRSGLISDDARHFFRQIVSAVHYLHAVSCYVIVIGVVGVEVVWAEWWGWSGNL